jgi:hypothetical protein
MPEDTKPGLEIFTLPYTRELLVAQVLKHYPQSMFFKAQIESALKGVWEKMAADGFVMGKAVDEATKNRMLGLTDTAFIAFRSPAQNGESK